MTNTPPSVPLDAQSLFTGRTTAYSLVLFFFASAYALNGKPASKMTHAPDRRIMSDQLNQ